MKSTITVLSRVLAFLIALTFGTTLQAQQPKTALPATPVVDGPHRLDIRVLVQGSAAARVKDRDWSQLFQEAGHRVTIATDNGNQTLGIRTRDSSRRSVVEVVGLVDRRGRLLLGKQQFRLGEPGPLKSFLNELQEHGPDGPIRQRPIWGLSVSQYTDVLKLLARPINYETQLSTPVETIKALQLPSEFRVTWSSESRKIAFSKQLVEGSIDLRPVSTGTGLAIAMAQFGLGYRVMKHPQTGYVLEIDVGGESDNLWPVGWKNKRPLTEILPKMFRHVAVDLEDNKVEDVVEMVVDLIDVPWFCSHQRLAANGTDFREIEYSTPPEKMSPFRLLHSMGLEHKMRMEMRTDEAGQLFLWCTTDHDQQAWKKRFAHVVPGKTE